MLDIKNMTTNKPTENEEKKIDMDYKLIEYSDAKFVYE